MVRSVDCGTRRCHGRRSATDCRLRHRAARQWQPGRRMAAGSVAAARLSCCAQHQTGLAAFAQLLGAFLPLEALVGHLALQPLDVTLILHKLTAQRRDLLILRLDFLLAQANPVLEQLELTVALLVRQLVLEVLLPIAGDQFLQVLDHGALTIDLRLEQIILSSLVAQLVIHLLQVQLLAGHLPHQIFLVLFQTSTQLTAGQQILGQLFVFLLQLLESLFESLGISVRT